MITVGKAHIHYPRVSDPHRSGADQTTSADEDG